MRRDRKPAAAPAPAIARAEKSPLPGLLWFGLTCLALLVAPWLGGMLSGVGPAVARALVCAAGLAWVVDRWGDWTVPRPAAWLWLYIGWSFLTALQGTNWHDSLTALSNLVTYAMLATMAADAARDAKRRKVLGLAMLLGFTVVAALGVWDGLHNVAGWRIFGPFTNPNLFAGYLITVLPLAFFLGMAGRVGGRALAGRPGGGDAPSPWEIAARILALMAVACGLAALGMTGSKGALAAFAVAVVLGGLAGRVVRQDPRPRTVLPFVAVVLLGAWLGGRVVLGRVEAAGTTQAHSGQFRTLTWEGAARMAAHHPVLGTGIGTFGSGFNKYAVAGWTEAAHNAYLQAAAETGVPGLVLFLAALGSAAVWLFRATRSEDRAIALLGAAGLAGLLAAAAHNLVDYGWTLWAPTAVLWALVGLGAGEVERARRPVPRLAAVAMLVPLGAALAGGILMANAAALADPATDPETRMAPDERVAALESARRLDPLDADLARRLGFARARAGDPAGAIVELEDATRLAPGEPAGWRQLGEAYRESGQTEKARAAFAEGLSHAPNAYRLLLDAARLAEDTGRHEEALDDYRRLVVAQEGPVGRYPATPELVPPEPLYAYKALAGDAEQRGDRAAALRYREALVALARRYEENRARYPLLWQATGQDDPRVLAEVQSMRKRSEAALQR